MKTLGIIGGTSWHSTIYYYEQINRLTGEVIGHQANPELIIYSINIELMRTQVKKDIFEKYLQVSRRLQTAGAEGIIIAANTPHMVYDHVQPKIDIPILHIAEATGEAAKEQKLSSLGLLGNLPTMTGDFIPSILKKKFDIETLIPNEDHLQQSHDYVSKELTQGIFSEEARDFYRKQIELLGNKGADGIILGCTELPLLLKDEPSQLPLLATTDLHIRKAVDFILS